MSDIADPRPTVLMAGGGRHLASIVTALVDAGRRVVLQAQDGAELAAASAAAAASPDSVHLIDTPIETFADADELVRHVVDAYGGLGALLTPPVPAEHDALVGLDPLVWQRHVTTYQKRAVGLARSAARHFVDGDHGGRVVTFSSADTFSSQGVGASAAHASMLSLASAVSGALRERGVTANCVVLGDPAQGGGPQADGPDMVAGLVAYLVSAEAAETTGRFFSAHGPDVGIYSMPLAIQNPHAIVRFSNDADASAVGTSLSPMLNIGRA